MTKKNILTIVLDSVFIVAFNLLFFINGGIVHTASVWTIYGFLHFAFFMVLVTPLISARGTTAIQSKTVIYAISLLYFFVELIFAIIFIFFVILGFRLTLSVEIIVTAIYLVVLTVNLLADDSTEKKQAKIENDSSFIKNISAKIKYILTLLSDKNAKSRLENLYDFAHSSPTKSSEAVKVYENEILKNLCELENAAEKNETDEVLKIALQIEKLLNKRNLEIKSLR